MPKSVTQILTIGKKAFERTGALDTILDVDTRLFIDPMLLRDTKIPELQGSARRIEDRFASILRLLKHSRAQRDVWERRAEQLMLFPEVRGICIGYSAKGTSGSGMGPALRRRLLADAKEIIRVGIEHPDIFELAGLFEEDIGPDRISDMVAGIIKVDLVAYTKRVLGELDVIREGQVIPINPYNNHPIILVPRDVLRDLPLALDWDDLALVASHNAALREEVNELIGSTWRKAANDASKHDVRNVMLKYPEILSDLIEQYRNKARARYDFDEDRAGQVVWHEAANGAAAEYPLQLKLPARPTIDDINGVVTAICNRFRELIENHGLWKLLYDNSGKPKHEEAAQLLFFGIAHAYCEANNLAISPESDGGRGPVDFKFAAGYELSVVVEVKLSRNKALKSGYTKQLPTYALAEKAKRGVYLVVDNGVAPQTLKSFNELVAMSQRSHLTVFYVDGMPKESASNL
jgi:hypothetical protein